MRTARAHSDVSARFSEADICIGVLHNEDIASLEV